MSKVIGITGKMGAGKSFVASKLINRFSNGVLIYVDHFRRNLLLHNQNYRRELEQKIPSLKGIWTGKELNECIYQDEKMMMEYKTILYRYLFETVNKINAPYILIEWPLFVQDDLLHYLNGLIIVEASFETRYKRVRGIDLSDEEIKQRMKLQEYPEFYPKLEHYKKMNPEFQYWVIENEKEGEGYAMFISNSEERRESFMGDNKSL